MVVSIQIDQIVSYLKNTSSVANIVSDRIYYGEPMREQSWTYIIINSISQIINPVSKQALVEFRIVWSNEWTTKKSLVDLANIITDSMCLTDTKQVYKLWNFEVYKIVEWWDFRIFIDEKNRNLLIKDYIFYFLS